MLRSDPGDLLPQRFGAFTLFDRIGQGGMAEIFLARTYTSLGHPRCVAIKMIRKHLCADDRFVRMLVAEANICASLRHVNIVQVFDLGRIDDRLYIAMEYVEGLDLHAMLRGCTRGRIRLPWEFSFFVLHEASRGLAHAHRARGPDGRPLGIVHRDLSPTNVLLSCEGEVRLCDFGIAKAAAMGLGDDAADAGRTATGAGMLKGKFGYMSPEQANGREVDARSDIFAFGILAWEILAGRRLFKGADETDTLRMARRGEVPPLPERGLPRPDLVGEFVARATARDPAGRFRSADEMHDALYDIMLAADIPASQIRFAEFIRRHFGDELIELRRERERALAVVAPLRHRLPEAGAPAGPPGGVDRRAGIEGPMPSPLPTGP